MANQEYNDVNVLLQAEDGQLFMVYKNLLMSCGVLRTMFELTAPSTDHIVPLPIESETLRRVLTWLKFHLIDHGVQSETDAWENRYFRMEGSEVVNVFIAADFLDIPTLQNAATLHIAHVINNSSEEELRERFQMQSDFEEDGENNRSEVEEGDLQMNNEDDIHEPMDDDPVIDDQD